MKKLKPDNLLDEDLLDWDAHIETPPKQSGTIKVKYIGRSKPTITYSAYLLHLLHTSWPDKELELIKAHYTARGVKAYIRDLTDNQTYALEIYPEEQ